MTDAKPRIVVGVDGSPGSRAALRWALRYAELSGGDVTALIASGPPVFIDLAVPMPGDDAADRADRELHEAVQETTALLGSDVPVNRVVVQDHPARALVDEAIDFGAQLLVSHHPLLLRGVHGVPYDDPKGRLVHRLIRSGIGLYCAQ